MKRVNVFYCYSFLLIILLVNGSLGVSVQKDEALASDASKEKIVDEIRDSKVVGFPGGLGFPLGGPGRAFPWFGPGGLQGPGGSGWYPWGGWFPWGGRGGSGNHGGGDSGGEGGKQPGGTPGTPGGWFPWGGRGGDGGGSGGSPGSPGGPNCGGNGGGPGGGAGGCGGNGGAAWFPWRGRGGNGGGSGGSPGSPGGPNCGGNGGGPGGGAGGCGGNGGAGGGAGGRGGGWIPPHTTLPNPSDARCGNMQIVPSVNGYTISYVCGNCNYQFTVDNNGMATGGSGNCS